MDHQFYTEWNEQTQQAKDYKEKDLAEWLHLHAPWWAICLLGYIRGQRDANHAFLRKRLTEIAELKHKIHELETELEVNKELFHHHVMSIQQPSRVTGNNM